jgi:hypothetical protein
MAMTGSAKTFLRTVLVVGGAAGAVAGFAMAANQRIESWLVGNLAASEIVYLALAGVSFLVLVAGLLMGRRMPLLLMVLGLAAFGAALSGLMHDFTGRAADLVLWLCGFFFGGAAGLMLARWIRN